MSSTVRLRITCVIILLSAVYGVLVAQSPAFARTMAVGYIGIVLTFMLMVNLWRKP